MVWLWGKPCRRRRGDPVPALRPWMVRAGETEMSKGLKLGNMVVLVAVVGVVSRSKYRMYWRRFVYVDIVARGLSKPVILYVIERRELIVGSSTKGR
jgi:hypothetical protein